MLKTFTIYPEKDSVRTAFRQGQRATSARLSLERTMDLYPEYLLKQADIPVAIVRGKEMVVGGEHFAVIPLLPLNWAETGIYSRHPNNVPYWDGEQRLRSLNDLLYSLSQGWIIPAALDDAVDAENDEFFANQHTLQHAQPPAYIGKIYPWTIWYRGGDGAAHQVILEATYEDAQRAWDKLITIFDVTSRRP